MAAKNPPPEELTAVYMAKALEAAEHAWQHARYLVGQAYRPWPDGSEEARRFADQIQNHADAGLAAFRAAKHLADIAGTVPAIRPDATNGGI